MSNVRLRYLLRPREVTNRTELQVLSVYRDHGVIPKNSRSDNFNKTPEDITRYQEVRVGDLVVNKMKAWQGSLGVSLHHGIVSPDYLVCSISPAVESRFLHYALRSAPFIAQFGIRSKGIRPAQWRLYWEDLAEIPISLPSVNQQRRIADFLDAETGQIDQLVNNQEQVIRLLEERVKSQVLEIVGRSRLAHPDGTNIAPIRRLLSKLHRATLATDEVITAFRDGQVTTRNARRSEGYTLTSSTEPQGQGVLVGDVVVHGLDGFAGAIGDSEAVGNCSPVYHVCTPIDGGNPTFYGRLLHDLAVNGYLGLFASSTRERAVDFRSWELFGGIPVPQVDPEIQHEIGASIVRIRPLREKVAHFNERLIERRRTLITAAVTGQIDVATARPKLSSPGGECT